MAELYAPANRYKALDHLFLFENVIVGSSGCGFKEVANMSELDGSDAKNVHLHHKIYNAAR